MNQEYYNSLDRGVRRLIDWQYGNASSFVKYLFETIRVADGENRVRLFKGFRLEVLAYINYARKTGWWDKIVNKLGDEE